MEFIYSISEALSDLKNNKITKLSILNGIFWGIIWLGLAIFLWDSVISFTTWMINLLPFKFVQNAGAEFILMISWLQMVLITIGVIFSLFSELMSKKVIPVIIALFISIFWFIIFFIYQESILIYLQKLIKIFPFESIEEAVSSVLAIFIFYSFYIASMYMGFLFLSAKFLEELQKEEYPNIKIDKNFSYFKLGLIIIRDLILFIIGLFMLYPLLFIPFVNIIIIISLWAFLIKESIVQTIFMIFGKEEINKKVIWWFSIISVIFNFLPIVNLFAPAFGILSVYHYVMEKKVK